MFVFVSQVKSLYHRAIKICHPDRLQGNSATIQARGAHVFDALNTAYNDFDSVMKEYARA